MTLTALEPTRFLWLEITGRCPWQCVHCYADSGPTRSHGAMTTADWLALIDQAAAAGVEEVQLIGGEPTLHPDFALLLDHALARGLAVEVYSNLHRVTETVWRALTQHGVRVATSYYSDTAEQTEAITRRRGSHTRARANIAEVVRRGIPIRVGVIDLGGEQRVEEAVADLVALGVPRDAIRVDSVRGFGRAAPDGPVEAETCGHCGHGAAAISPDGLVSPCVFTRYLSAGDVRDGQALTEVLAGDTFAAAVARLDAAHPGAGPTACIPEPRCSPKSACTPSCTPSCRPFH